MGRAIDLENRIDKLEFQVNEILLILDELSKINTTKENIDIHEATKEQKDDDEGSRKPSVKSNSRKSKKSNDDSDDSVSTK
tara:strand:+ start:42 stop:284 length:243 start_codon:yes stop_codon:yes gene_type:complete